MPKLAYIATDADGKVHTRNSDRVYTHTVVFKGGYKRAQSNARDSGWAKTDKSNFSWYTSIANGTREWQSWEDDAKRAEILVNAKSEIDGCADAAAYHVKCLEQRIARVEERKANGDFDFWANAGWCGRLDLAQKLAAQWQAKGYEVAILPAATK